MSIRYDSLDASVRKYMIEEIHRDQLNGTLYISPRLTAEGERNWLDLLGEACTRHDDAWLAQELRARGYIRAEEQRRSRTGGYTTVRVPITAPDTLAEGEFNRFYARSLCRDVIASGGTTVEVYRGKSVENPRTASELLIGKLLPAQQLLDDLRTAQGVEPALQLPPGPNSGLTIRRT
jgi:hypothetical protein